MKIVTRIAVLCMFALIVGCAITDWNAYPGHRTTAEAKLYTKEIGWSGTGYAELDGTYAYTVKYDNSDGQFNPLLGGVYIYTYRNPVLSSFTRDGQFNEDGDYVQGHSGILGGKYQTQWIAVDTDPATCGFFAGNVTFSKTGSLYGTALCFYAGSGYYYAENDRDFEIHGEYADWDALLYQVWNGGALNPSIVGIRLDGTTRPITPWAIYVKHNATTPYSIDFTPQGLRGAIQTILDNTENMVPVQLGVVLAGGLTYDMPHRAKVAFNHDSLRKILNRLDAPAPAPPVHKKYR